MLTSGTRLICDEFLFAICFGILIVLNWIHLLVHLDKNFRIGDHHRDDTKMSILPCWGILEGEYLSTLGYPSTDCRIHGGVRRQRFDGPPSWDMFIILLLIISNDKISPKSWREVTIVGLKVVNVLALVGRLDQVAGVGQMRHGAANRLFSYVIPTSNVIDNLAGRTSYQSLLVGCYRYISPMFNIFTTNTVVYLCIRYCNFKNESRFSQIWMTKQIFERQIQFSNPSRPQLL